MYVEYDSKGFQNYVMRVDHVLQVFRLEQLAVANFSNNRIVSVLEFCRWNALQQLNLSYNQLSVIPVFLFQSTQLRKLVVTGNKLKALPM